jgi:upstream activation factor subunit UAF30
MTPSVQESANFLLKGREKMPKAKKGSAKKSSAKAKSSGGKRTAGLGLMREVQPSAELAAVIGSRPLPRTEVTKKIWDYIKANGLQDQQNRRMINADAKLRPVFGGKSKVSMFEMTKLVNGHLK